MQPVNTALRRHAAPLPDVELLDLYPSFVDESGAPRRSLFNDGLHPSRDGDRVWRDRLATVLPEVPAA